MGSKKDKTADPDAKIQATSEMSAPVPKKSEKEILTASTASIPPTQTPLTPVNTEDKKYDWTPINTIFAFVYTIFGIVNQVEHPSETVWLGLFLAAGCVLVVCLVSSWLHAREKPSRITPVQGRFAAFAVCGILSISFVSYRVNVSNTTARHKIEAAARAARVQRDLDAKRELRAENLQALNDKLLDPTINWITYEPTDEDPYRKPQGYYGDVDSIPTELARLKKAGFTGLVTFSAEGASASIPELAHGLGFRAIIMGVTHVDKEIEIQHAVKAKYVDGYCIGHNALARGISISVIISAMQRVRSETQKPVTTTLNIRDYPTYKYLNDVSDWFMPDAHYEWTKDTDASNAERQLAYKVRQLAQFRDVKYPQKLIQLKMLGLPTNDTLAGEKAQASYLQWCWQYFQHNCPPGIWPTYFSGYDIPWKTPSMNWGHGEMSVGLFTAKGDPKLVVKSKLFLGTQPVPYNP
jgi:exo-beta-1,3-glucanase (GH17 family)